MRVCGEMRGKTAVVWRVTRSAVLMGVIFGVSGPAAAAIYSQAAQVSGSGFGDLGADLDDSTRVARDAFEGDRTVRSGFAIARSSDGFLSGLVQASMSPGETNPVASGFASAQASASLTLTDVVVTRLPGFESLPGTVAMTAQVSFDAGTDFADLSNISGGLGGGSAFSPALLSAETPTMTSTAQVLVDQPVSLSLAASISVRVEGGFNTRDGTFTVSLGGSPVFLLPEGYVANSIDGRVVDNFYVGPVNAVPEPGMAAAWLGLGAYAVGCRWRRRAE